MVAIIITNWNWVNVLYEHIEMLSIAFITNPQKACAHSSLYIHNQDKKSAALLVSNPLRNEGFFLEKKNLLFFCFVHSNEFGKWFQITQLYHQPSTVADLFVYNLNIFLSVSVIIITIFMIPKCASGIAALSRGSLLNPFQHMLMSRAMIGSQFFFFRFCILYLVIEWVHLRNQKWNGANFSWFLRLCLRLKTHQHKYIVNWKWFNGVRHTWYVFVPFVNRSNESNAKCLIIRFHRIISFHCRMSKLALPDKSTEETKPTRIKLIALMTFNYYLLVDE